jgi:hypothetical protein
LFLLLWGYCGVLKEDLQIFREGGPGKKAVRQDGEKGGKKGGKEGDKMQKV